MPEGVLGKTIGTFYYGVVGDFRSWEMDLRIEILQFPAPIGSPSQLASYVASFTGGPTVLKSGETIFTNTEPKVESVGSFTIVTAESRDLRFLEKIVLRDEVITTNHPHHIAYVPIDDNLVVMFYIDHEKRANAAAFSRSREIISQIISQMRFQHGVVPDEITKPNQPPQRNAGNRPFCGSALSSRG